MLLEEGVCYDQCVLLAKLLAFALLHSVLRAIRNHYFLFLFLKIGIENCLIKISHLVVSWGENLPTFSIYSFVIFYLGFLSFIVSLENYTMYAIIHFLKFSDVFM